MTSKAVVGVERIQAWQRSGQSQTAFCREHGLNQNTFGYWRRKSRISGAAGLAAAGQRRRLHRECNALVPVVVSGSSATTFAEVCVPNGLRLRVPLGSDATEVAVLVRALLAC